MQIAGASAYVDLVFHALSLIPPAAGAAPAARAASLYAPAYAASLAAARHAELLEPIATDATLLSTLLADPAPAQGVSLLAALHGSIDELVATARWDLSALAPAHAAAPEVLSWLQALPRAPLEILRADLLLLAPAFARYHAQELAPRVATFVAAARAVALDGLPLPEAIEVSGTLGPHGRVLPSTAPAEVGAAPRPGRVIVGVADWGDPRPTLALAFHEHAVDATSEAARALGLAPEWARVEPVALALEAEFARGSAIEAAVAAWHAALDRSGLAPLDTTLHAAAAARLTAAAKKPKKAPS